MNDSYRWIVMRLGLLGPRLGRSTVAAALLVAGWGCSSHSGRAVAPLSAASKFVAGAYPTSPPARICGNHAILDGPATAPPGAVTVTTSINLYDATQAAGPGTTFWLTPGVHTLGTNQYNQVIPKDRDTYEGGPGAILDGQKINFFAFTQTAVGVTIRNLTVRNFGPPGSDGNEGVINGDGGAGWTMEALTVQDNAGAGVFLGSHNIVEDNCLEDNGQYGFNMFEPKGITDITLSHNEIVGNNTDNWEKRVPGCGCTGGGKFWDVRGATVTDNWVHNNHGTGLWADTDDAVFSIEGNYIDDNDAPGIIYEISYNAVIRNNTLVRNALVEGRTFAAEGDNFPVGAIYVSESGGDSRVDPRDPVLEISGNNFVDNWGGVTLWENADRFCGSPNVSPAYCTLVGTVSTAACNEAKIDQPPQFADCRWHTQNVEVTDNRFTLDKAAIGCTRFCGFQAIISNYGSSPAWSPYKGTVIEQDITFKNNNHFSANEYVGPWQFMGQNTGVNLTFGQWQASPYHQDAGSTLSS